MSRNPKTDGVFTKASILGQPAPEGGGNAPSLAFDESQPSELLVNTRDVPTSRWRDGDVIQVFSAENALRVHAETIASGRGLYKGDALPALRATYDRISNQRRRVPSRDELLAWWNQAEALAGLNRNDFARYPFTALEQRIFLVLPVAVDLTPALRQRWRENGLLRKYKLSVKWREAVVSTRLAAQADILNRKTPVRINTLLPVSIVTTEVVSAEEEEITL